MENNIHKAISGLKNLEMEEPATVDEVLDSSLEIGVQFAEDFVRYLFKYGTVNAHGIELFGISKCEDNAVVVNTLRCREEISHMPDDVYVIERLGIDNIVAVQNTNGEVFTISPTLPLVKHGDCLADHIKWSTEFDEKDWKKFNKGKHLPESVRRQMLKKECIEYWKARLEQMKKEGTI